MDESSKIEQAKRAAAAKYEEMMPAQLGKGFGWADAHAEAATHAEIAAADVLDPNPGDATDDAAWRLAEQLVLVVAGEYAARQLAEVP